MATLAQIKAAANAYVVKASQAGAWTTTTEGISGLVNKITKQVRLEQNYNDKLPELDGDQVNGIIEEYFLELTTPTTYTNTAGVITASDLATEGAKDLAPAVPTFKDVVYSYPLKPQKFKTTIPYNRFIGACNDASQVASIVGSIISNFDGSKANFKYAAKKQLLGNLADKAVTANLYTNIAAPSNTTTGEAFLKQVKEDIETASFAHAGGLGGNDIGAAPSLVLYVKKGVMPSLEVDTLAGAFHEERLALNAQVKVLDDFGTMTNSGVYAILVDPRGVKLHEQYMHTLSQENADGDYINYVTHENFTGYISKNVFVKVYKPQ